MNRRAVDHALDRAREAGGAELGFACRGHTLAHPPLLEVAREGDAAHLADGALLGEQERTQRAPYGTHAELDHALASRNVAGADHAQLHGCSHPCEERGQNVLHVMRGRREILEDASGDPRRDRLLGEAGQGQEAESQHRRRPRGSDVEVEGPAADPRSRDEDELAGADRDPFDPGSAERGAGPHRGHVLGTQTRLLAPGAGVAEAKGTPEQRGEGRSEADDRAAPGSPAAVDVDHLPSTATSEDGAEGTGA